MASPMSARESQVSYQLLSNLDEIASNSSASYPVLCPMLLTSARTSPTFEVFPKGSIKSLKDTPAASPAPAGDGHDDEGADADEAIAHGILGGLPSGAGLAPSRAHALACASS